MKERIEVIKLNDHIYLMDDNHEATGYLVIGREKALVIDTMNGRQNVKEVAERYTDLPLMVVNTHGHPDHIYGNIYFDEACMNPDDWYVAREACMDPEFIRETEAAGLKMPAFKDIRPGDEIDLGGLTLSVIGLPGHTPGSILLLLKEDRILFTGDAINHHLWMQVHHATSMEMFKASLEKVLYLEKEADRILHGHARDFDDISLLRKIYEAVCEIVDGKTRGDRKYKWFGGEAKTHRIPGDDGVICYVPVPERVWRTRRAWARSDAKRDAGLKEPEGILAFRDITYNVFGIDSLLDVYMPGDHSEKMPVLVNVHGGGYFYGDKELYKYYSMDMAMRGFAVVNINYRKSPEYRFPSALQDINEVMCWIEKHAGEYYMDTDRIFMMGDSAGAQLASHYGAINSDPGFKALYPLREHGLKIKGLALACGMYDMPAKMSDEGHSNIMRDYFAGGHKAGDRIVDVLGAVTKDYPPSYVFSASYDFLKKDCKPMADLINSRGSRAEYKIYGTKKTPEACHVFHCNLKLPLGEKARKDQAEFLLSIK